MATHLERTGPSFPSLIDDYGRCVGAAFLQQHTGNSVASPLGIWLLLAACVTAASGADKDTLEEALGCSCAEAADHLHRFLDDPPSALHCGLALWVRKEDLKTRLVEWSASLPRQAERGPLPTKAAADTWIDRHSQGLIPEFPLDITALTRLLLVSVLATKVSWEKPFNVVPATSHLPSSSPWSGRIECVLFERLPGGHTMLATTKAAGIVAVHLAQAIEDVGVLSVTADPGVGRAQVLEAAYELAAMYREGTLSSVRVSLFDLPLGRGHSWELTEREHMAQEDGPHETIESAVLVAWDAECSTDLRQSPAFAVNSALEALLDLIGRDPRGDVLEAVHSARASYTAEGFEAAAASVLSVKMRGLAGTRPNKKVIERRAKLFFDHPHAVIALAGSSADFLGDSARRTDRFCLPLFVAWVAEPSDPAGEHADWDE